MFSPYRIVAPDAQSQLAASKTEFSFYLEKLMKMIPAEMIALYLVGSGLIPAETDPVFLVIWSAVCLVGVVVLRALGTRDSAKGGHPQWSVVLVSSMAFAIWVYTLGGPFALYGLHIPFIGSLVVLAWTFFVPIVLRGASS